MWDWIPWVPNSCNQYINYMYMYMYIKGYSQWCQWMPIDDSLTIIRDTLSADKDLEDRTILSVTDICHLTELCLISMNFRYNEKFFEHTTMGSSLSPVVANIFMEDFEQTILTTANHQQKLWLRYVDDTFVLWQHGDKHLPEFLQHLNGLHNRTLFTMKKEDHHKLPFLDVLVERTNNILKTDLHVYRKPTHANLYLHYQTIILELRVELLDV